MNRTEHEPRLDLISEVSTGLRSLTGEQIDAIVDDERLPRWFSMLVMAEDVRREFMIRWISASDLNDRGQNVLWKAATFVSVNGAARRKDELDEGVAAYLHSLLLLAEEANQLYSDLLRETLDATSSLKEIISSLSDDDLWFALNTILKITKWQARHPSPLYAPTPSRLH